MVHQGGIMARFSTILFDLDGTISDPKSGITKSVAYALDYEEIISSNISSLFFFIV